MRNKIIYSAIFLFLFSSLFPFGGEVYAASSCPLHSQIKSAYEKEKWYKEIKNMKDRISDFCLSPDKKVVSFFKNNGKTASLVLYSLTAKKITSTQPISIKNVDSYYPWRWPTNAVLEFAVNGAKNKLILNKFNHNHLSFFKLPITIAYFADNPQYRFIRCIF